MKVESLVDLCVKKISNLHKGDLYRLNKKIGTLKFDIQSKYKTKYGFIPCDDLRHYSFYEDIFNSIRKNNFEAAKILTLKHFEKAAIGLNVINTQRNEGNIIREEYFKVFPWVRNQEIDFIEGIDYNLNEDETELSNETKTDILWHFFEKSLKETGTRSKFSHIVSEFFLSEFPQYIDEKTFVNEDKYVLDENLLVKCSINCLKIWHGKIVSRYFNIDMNLSEKEIIEESIVRWFNVCYIIESINYERFDLIEFIVNSLDGVHYFNPANWLDDINSACLTIDSAEFYVRIGLYTNISAAKYFTYYHDFDATIHFLQKIDKNQWDHVLYNAIFYHDYELYTYLTRNGIVINPEINYSEY